MFLRQRSRKTGTTGCPRVLSLIAWALVLFYLVASGRAFLPGVCATQRAMDAQCGVTGGDLLSGGGHGCCAVKPPEEAEERDGSKRPITPEESGCALCKLVSAMAPLSPAVVLPQPADSAFAPAERPVLAWATRFDERACPKRAPPA